MPETNELIAELDQKFQEVWDTGRAARLTLRSMRLVEKEQPGLKEIAAWQAIRVRARNDLLVYRMLLPLTIGLWMLAKASIFFGPGNLILVTGVGVGATLFWALDGSTALAFMAAVAGATLAIFITLMIWSHRREQ